MISKFLESFKVRFLVFLCCVGLLFAKPVIVSSKKITRGSLDSQNTFLGVINFKERSNIASQSSGVVERVLFNLGEKVKKGDELVVLNSDLLQKEIQSKNAKLEQAKLLREFQEKELKRYKNLLETDSIALQQYEKLSYELKVQELVIASLLAEVDQAQVEISKKTIKAPFDGVIVGKNVNIGEWIKVGDSICEILNHSEPQAIVDVPSPILSYIKVGDVANVSVNSKSYSGKITAIIPKADSRSRTFPVIISLPSEGNFVEGMAVNAMLKSGGKSEGFLVPRDSIIDYRNRPCVFVIKNGVAMAVNVDILAIQGDVAVVRGGLDLKDRVIYKGQYRLQNGAEVKES